MSQGTIRTAVYNAVNGVANVGKVYDRERFSDSWDTFLNLFKTRVGNEDQIRGWMVTYGGNETERIGNSCGIRHHSFIVRGFIRFHDDDTSAQASEIIAAALVEAVCDALDSDVTVHGFEDATGATSVMETRIFGSVLVHYTEITLTVRESVTVA